MTYEIRFVPAADAEYSWEYEWSIRQWGEAHADDFFEEIDYKIQLLETNPHLHIEHISDNFEYRLINLKGLRIAYHVGEPKKLVTILAFIGRNRFHELERLVSERAGKI